MLSLLFLLPCCLIDLIYPSISSDENQSFIKVFFIAKMLHQFHIYVLGNSVFVFYLKVFNCYFLSSKVCGIFKKSNKTTFWRQIRLSFASNVSSLSLSLSFIC